MAPSSPRVGVSPFPSSGRREEGSDWSSGAAAGIEAAARYSEKPDALEKKDLAAGWERQRCLGWAPEHPGAAPGTGELPARCKSGGNPHRSPFTTLRGPHVSDSANLTRAELNLVCLKQGCCGFDPFGVTLCLIKPTQPLQDGVVSPCVGTELGEGRGFLGYR